MTIPNCVIRQKRRACDLFGGGGVDPRDHGPDDTKWKQIKKEIKEKNEFARIDEQVGTNIARMEDGSVVPGVDQKQMMKALTSGRADNGQLMLGPAEPMGPTAPVEEGGATSSSAELNLTVYNSALVNEFENGP